MPGLTGQRLADRVQLGVGTQPQPQPWAQAKDGLGCGEWRPALLWHF